MNWVNAILEHLKNVTKAIEFLRNILEGIVNWFKNTFLLYCDWAQRC